MLLISIPKAASGWGKTNMIKSLENSLLSKIYTVTAFPLLQSACSRKISRDCYGPPAFWMERLLVSIHKLVKPEFLPSGMEYLLA
ncbi:MAG: hypothetical protein ACD_39C01931G0003 [uncultured bacterium]|nr:MAG: hypothetical protein ACD_39C01931G0003 [uncultured bacterium]